MILVEYLRARHAFIVFGAILALIVLGIALSVSYAVHFGHAVTNGDVSISVGNGGAEVHRPAPHQSPSEAFGEADFKVPLSILCAFAAFAALVLATILGTSLNSENDRGGFAFTKPVSREQLALTYFAVDAVAVVAVFALSMLLGFVGLWIVGILGRLYVDASALEIAVTGLAEALMWYGLLQVVSAPLRPRLGNLRGISWPIFLGLAAMYGFTGFGPIFHDFVAAVDFLNPLVYDTSLNIEGPAVTTSSIVGLSEPVRLAITSGIGILGCGLAALNWRRVEA